jgi:hypothetical protein
VGHAARTGERTGACRVLVGRLEGKNHLEVLGLDGRIMLKLIFKKWDGRACDLAQSWRQTFRVP